jgi:hypothetical protein
MEMAMTDEETPTTVAPPEPPPTDPPPPMPPGAAEAIETLLGFAKSIDRMTTAFERIATAQEGLHKEAVKFNDLFQHDVEGRNPDKYNG